MSTIVALVGPIEWWWNTPEDPARFHSMPAVHYRDWRERLSRYLVDQGYLVFRPHEAFKGTWDERAQIFNDEIIKIADVVINMRPPGVPGKGTDHELALARDLGKTIVNAPPGTEMQRIRFQINNRLSDGPWTFKELVKDDLIG